MRLRWWPRLGLRIRRPPRRPRRQNRLPGNSKPRRPTQIALRDKAAACTARMIESAFVRVGVLAARPNLQLRLSQTSLWAASGPRFYGLVGMLSFDRRRRCCCWFR